MAVLQIIRRQRAEEQVGCVDWSEEEVEAVAEAAEVVMVVLEEEEEAEEEEEEEDEEEEDEVVVEVVVEEEEVEVRYLSLLIVTCRWRGWSCRRS